MEKDLEQSTSIIKDLKEELKEKDSVPQATWWIVEALEHATSSKEPPMQSCTRW